MRPGGGGGTNWLALPRKNLVGWTRISARPGTFRHHDDKCGSHRGQNVNTTISFICIVSSKVIGMRVATEMFVNYATMER